MVQCSVPAQRIANNAPRQRAGQGEEKREARGGATAASRKGCEAPSSGRSLCTLSGGTGTSFEARDLALAVRRHGIQHLVHQHCTVEYRRQRAAEGKVLKKGGGDAEPAA